MHTIKSSLSDPQVADSILRLFNKAISFLHISGQRNIYQGDSAPAEAIISMLDQEVEFQDFFCTFDKFVKVIKQKKKLNG